MAASSIPRNILVTGSNRGIGFELVKQLARHSSPPQKIFAATRTVGTSKSRKLEEFAHSNTTSAVDVSYIHNSNSREVGLHYALDYSVC